jgi:hypothetical protein
LSRLTSYNYPKLIERWKSTATTPYKRGSISDDGINLVVGAETDTVSIEFYLAPKTQTLEIIMRGFDAGHRVQWSMPMDDVPSEALVAYERFVRRGEETGEVGFARRHKRFTGWFKMSLDELIAKSRADARVFAQGGEFFLNTDEIVTEYDYEIELLSRIRREGGKALISSYANSLTEISSQIADLNLEETLAAMVKHRYGKQQLINGSWVDVWP